MTMLQYLIDHPELWGYVILPLLGAILNAVARAAGARWPALQPVLRSLLDALPNLVGAAHTLKDKRPLDPPVPPSPAALLRTQEKELK